MVAEQQFTIQKLIYYQLSDRGATCVLAWTCAPLLSIHCILLTTFFHIGLRGRGVVDEHYVTLGGCTVQRYEALQGGGGVSSF